ncbi:MULTISPECIES: N-formylglutamate amidohydrolase [unclassified Sphingomonas]|jgi:N-formylglutamate amidohydrolase|uniref:N-formylglutamate amidohydrolase n=1 Tax=unclassified Sphingomonas TaxID=196159 RepID=UPI000E10968C|nr:MULTISPECIES: N-formylglutamate amidohydrolase [unclassified Sphingomonas]AXJ95654.1 N-formylglutamate amidohydrolase [Sphingomonas sp. FARSPH]
MDGSFDQFGATPPASPVVLSVPHAGRDYPAILASVRRVPAGALVVLEDRHVDAVAQGARGDQAMLVQRRARAWIDLNRGEDERDALVDEGVRPQGQAQASAKLRSGLGLVPRRGGVAGDLWRRRFTAAEVEARIVGDHRPYHRALASALAAAHARFGIAVLLDIHSMPPLGTGARVVLGDRFGKSADSRFVARLEAEAAMMGIGCARNSPYAGGHILARHAAPDRGIHGVQIEFDRSLYLDAALDRPGPGMRHTVALLQNMIAAVEDEALNGGAVRSETALAAE